MTKKIFPILFMMAILLTGTAAALDIIPDVDALKSQGTALTEIGSGKVCGDRLCSEIKSSDSSDISSENYDDKMNAMMMEKEKSMMEEKSMMMDKMMDKKSAMMDKKSMMMDKEKFMMMDKMMEIHSTVNGDLTAPAGDTPFGGNVVGDYSVMVTKNDMVTISATIDYDSSGMVLEGWLVDGDSDYKLSLGKADQKGQLVFEQALVNPWIYDVLVITEEPIGDTDPSPNKPVGASLLAEPFGQ